MILVATQSWTAHHNHFPLHRIAGEASLFMFPLLIAGLCAIIDVTAKGSVSDDGSLRGSSAPAS